MPPVRPVFVFDGDCAFCTSSAGVLGRVNRRMRYDVAPWQRLDLGALGLTREQCLEAAAFVAVDGRVTGGHRAIAAALRLSGPGWALIGRLLVVPGVSGPAAAAYRWVAAHRHRLPGGTPACAVGPTGRELRVPASAPLPTDHTGHGLPPG